MMIADATHRKIAGEIHRLIRQEQYADAQDLLPSFAQAVIDACNESGQEQEFVQAKQFLQSAVIAVKSRQAHYISELSDLGRERVYVGVREQMISFDCVG
jgi:hypothetical protein